MLATTIPELLRTSLTEICLMSKLMVGDTMKIEEFLQKCIASPSLANIRQSIKFLQCLGALDQNEGLTLLGSHLAEMPVDAKYAKMLIYGIVLKCLNPVLSIVSILSVGDQIFVLPIRPDDRFKCHQVRRKLAEDSVSDHYVMYKLFELWTNLKRNNMNDRRFCEENFISSPSMDHVRGIRGQILSYLQSSGLIKDQAQTLNVNSRKWSVVKACMGAGLYPNVARIDRQRKTMYSDIDRKLVFHMSSILSQRNERSLDFVKHLPADWCVFEEKNRIGRTPMIRCNTLINSFSLSLTAGASLRVHVVEGDWSDEEGSEEEEKVVFKIDNLVTFETAKESADLIFDLREKLDDLILRFLVSRNLSFEKKTDEQLVNTIGQVLDIEEKNSGFANVNLQIKNGAVQAQSGWRNPPNGHQTQQQMPPKMRNRNEQQQSAPSSSSQGQWRSQTNSNQHDVSLQRNDEANQNKWNPNNGQRQTPQRTRNLNAPAPAPSRSIATGPQAQWRSQSNGNDVNTQRNDEVNPTNWRNQKNPPNGHQQKPQRTKNFNAPAPGPSRNIATGPQTQWRSPTTNSKQKYFAMKMNSDKQLNDLAARIVFDLELLNLSQWFMQKLLDTKMVS